MEFLRFFIVVAIATPISYFVSWEIPKDLITTLFSLMGIMFSVGLGLVVSFNLQGVKNPKFLRIFRKNLNSVRNKFILYFTLTSIFYILSLILQKEITFTNMRLATLIIIAYFIIYYIHNFVEIQKLSNDLFDELNR